jgi:hypothetical protein
MQYKIEISHTTGRLIEEKYFFDPAEARHYFEEVVRTKPYQRVLVILSQCPSPYMEEMLEVDFIDGVSLNPALPPAFGQFDSLQPAANRKSDQP